MSTLTKTYGATIAKGAANSYSMVVSTSSRDRDGDVILPTGIDLTNFRKNPVLLWSHNHHEPPIGRVTNLFADDHALTATFVFAEGDDFAKRIWNLVDQRIVRSASIGFVPRAWQPLDDGRGRRFTATELLEISLVALPANPEAVRQLKSLAKDYPTRVTLPADDSIVVVDTPLARDTIVVDFGGGRRGTFDRRELVEGIADRIKAGVADGVMALTGRLPD